MKQIIFTLIIAFSLLKFNSFSQCEPMTPEQCPDPENNGEVCPDSLEAAYINQFYSQVATIKPPAVYYLPPDSTEINLHYVKLMNVGNLPEGITWQSNTPDSIFTAGEYYCVLMEGTPVLAGIYPLNITVDVYVLVFGTPVKVATVVDSTSLNVLVIDNSGINDHSLSTLAGVHNVPNPFAGETSFTFWSEQDQAFIFEIYSQDGRKQYSEDFFAFRGSNNIIFNGQHLAKGMYFFRLRSEDEQVSGIMIRADH
jgi:hypothetical protein